MTANPNTDELLHTLILDFLEKEEEWFELPTKEKKKLFSLYETIIRTVSDFAESEESPVIVVWDSNSKKVALQAINNLRTLFPEVERISVSIIN